MLEYMHDECAALWHLMLKEIALGPGRMSSCDTAEKMLIRKLTNGTINFLSKISNKY